MITAFILFCLTIYLIIRFSTQKPQGIPPGKMGWPLIGDIVPSNKKFREHLYDLKKQYGGIYSYKRGNRLCVVLSDYDLIKTAFNKPEMSGRPDFFTYGLFSMFQNIGLTVSTERVWQENRRFALRHLRDLGMGKSWLEDAIKIEIENLLAEFEKNINSPIELSWIINVAILNIIWNLISSKRYDIRDPDLCNFAEKTMLLFEAIDGPMKYLDMYPSVIPFVPTFIKNKWMGLDVFTENFNVIIDFFGKIIKEHEAKLDPSNPKDYIDWYLLEMEKNKSNPDYRYRQDYMDLYASLGDLFTNGSETTSSSIRFMFLYMILYPDIQEKIQKQIDEVVPRDEYPSLEHRDKLIYLDATLSELQRVISLTPLGVPHAPTEDTEIAGYKIPKGTVIYPFVEDCHNNPKYWKFPNKFYPEHFIDENGKLITKKDGYVPFSVGRRVCIGENFARMELYLFVAAILQRFKISGVPGENYSHEIDKDTTQFNGIRPYKVILNKRY